MASLEVMRGNALAMVDNVNPADMGKSCLWSVSTKTEKSVKLGLADISLVLYLKPGVFCPKATEACLAGCLGDTSGHLAMPNGNAQRAMLRRSKWYLEDRQAFQDALIAEACDIVRSWKRSNSRTPKVLVRLNGTSDLPWDATRLDLRRALHGDADLRFYEYTKKWELHRRFTLDAAEKEHAARFACVHVLSRHENTKEWEVLDACQRGYTVAVVFSTKAGQALPETYLDLPVIDGDLHDDRTVDPVGCIVGLRAKGAMRKGSAMVVQV
jgi:hypothetical protein